MICKLSPLEEQNMAGIDEESSPSPHGGGLLDCVGLDVIVRQSFDYAFMKLSGCHSLFSDKRECLSGFRLHIIFIHLIYNRELRRDFVADDRVFDVSCGIEIVGIGA